MLHKVKDKKQEKVNTKQYPVRWMWEDWGESQEKRFKNVKDTYFKMNSVIYGEEESLMEITLLKIVDGFINLHVTFWRINGRRN